MEKIYLPHVYAKGEVFMQSVGPKQTMQHPISVIRRLFLTCFFYILLLDHKEGY